MKKHIAAAFIFYALISSPSLYFDNEENYHPQESVDEFYKKLETLKDKQ